MKTIIKKTALFSFLALTFLFIGCTSNDDSSPNEVNFSAEDSQRAAQADNVVEGTFSIMESGYVQVEEEPDNVVNSLFPACTVITILPNGDGGTIILDFGDECQLNNGSVVSGMITLEYGPFTAGTRTINYTFDEFTYNGNGVAGGGEIFREIANSNGNPQSTINEEITVSFPNTTVTATRNGLRVAEWVEGIGTGTWLDNVYHITGNWDTVFTNGFQRSGEVTETLVRKLNCLYLVSGMLEVQQEGLTAAIDWGEGECDNLATFIFNGQEYPIIL
ncbi:hypothetical protein [Constantimarinum furrinae]|uniref:Lipoprotein n=1 Tax=Constantimarinum furrinae TaxID=2562285 RepID=A0A7G8PRE4_9FLAO|nr:hypothetical protein [Constantimarinum furrinae]QNJ96910.1 hypothetical protein ALE3EI_0323 [Constantimarinum furrinae]